MKRLRVQPKYNQIKSPQKEPGYLISKNKMVGAAGFEPATSCSQSEASYSGINISAGFQTYRVRPYRNFPQPYTQNRNQKPQPSFREITSRCRMIIGLLQRIGHLLFVVCHPSAKSKPQYGIPNEAPLPSFLHGLKEQHRRPVTVPKARIILYTRLISLSFRLLICVYYVCLWMFQARSTSIIHKHQKPGSSGLSVFV